MVFVLSDITFSFVSLEFPTANIAALQAPKTQRGSRSPWARRQAENLEGTRLHTRSTEDGEEPNFPLAGPATLRKCQAKKAACGGGLVRMTRRRLSEHETRSTAIRRHAVSNRDREPMSANALTNTKRSRPYSEVCCASRRTHMLAARGATTRRPTIIPRGRNSLAAGAASHDEQEQSWVNIESLAIATSSTNIEAIGPYCI